MRPNKKKMQWQQYIAMLFFVLLGGACGIWIVNYMDTVSAADRGWGEELFFFACWILGLYLAIFLQLIVHEAGHLLFGLWTGYGFSSFRIGNFMWVKEGEALRFRRLSLAGTGGQCLMTPPEWNSEHFPTFWYNLGGSAMNLVFSAIFLAAVWIFPEIPVLSLFCKMVVASGVVFAIVNGVPMRMGMVDNDGYNAFALAKNAEARRSFWVQMKVNQQISRGIRLKDMPDEWFAVPTDEGMKNTMTVVLGVFACNRLLDEQRFPEALTLMQKLCRADTAMCDLHRNLLICDCITCELLLEKRPDVLTEFWDKPQKNFMKSMKKYPSVIRTEYCYALLAEKDPVRAQEILSRFEKAAKTYPYPSEVQAERELMAIAAERAR